MSLGMINALFYPTDINVNSTFDSLVMGNDARLKKIDNDEYELVNGKR